MASKDKAQPPDLASKLPFVLDVYGRVMSGILLLMGLFHWAVILGIAAGQGGLFDEMTTAWKMATINLAVVDLVAAVGLWQRVAWGNVIWVYAALFEVAMHTVFVATFGTDYLVVAFHVFTIGGFVALNLIARRAAQ